MTYEIQDRCDRLGLGVAITCEGSDYYIVYQGEIQRWLGSSKKTAEAKYRQPNSETANDTLGISNVNDTTEGENIDRSVKKGPCPGLFDKILFFVGDLECASRKVKRFRTS